MSWDQLAAGVELPFDPDLTVPELHRYPLDVPSPPAVPDVERGAYDAAVATFADVVTPGMTVAVGAGSRGLTSQRRWRARRFASVAYCVGGVSIVSRGRPESYVGRPRSSTRARCRSR